jgi:hypothetical protein
MQMTSAAVAPKCFMVLAGAACIALGAATPTLASSFTYTGTTVGEPTFHRPFANGADVPFKLAPAATAVSFSAFEFHVDTTGLYNFLSTSTTPTNWDNYTFLYVNSFDSTKPLENIIIANNDLPTKGLSGFNDVSLTAGLSYFLVTSGFGNADQGEFTNTIANASRIIAGPVTAVPTPALLPGLVAMGIAAIRKKKADTSTTL